jgi:hypothetical protein
MKNKILTILFALATSLAANNASAYYSPSTGRWLSRDPIGEPGFELLRAASTVPKVGQITSTASLPPSRTFVRDTVLKNEVNSYVLVKNDPESKVDFLGLAQTFFYWTPAPCGNGTTTAFIQVGLGGSLFYPNPFVDDGTHGLFSTSANCPPLYPASSGGTFGDQAGNALGTVGLNGLTFEVCRVCLQPCCAGPHRQAPNQRFPTPGYSGYSIVSIGPCVTYTIPGSGNDTDLGSGPSNPSPSSGFSGALNSAYPNVSSGGCISCKKLN